MASLIDAKRFNERWSDVSHACIDADIRAGKSFLKRCEAPHTGGFPVQEQLNLDLMVRKLRQGRRVISPQWRAAPVRRLESPGAHIRVLEQECAAKGEIKAGIGRL